MTLPLHFEIHPLSLRIKLNEHNSRRRASTRNDLERVGERLQDISEADAIAEGCREADPATGRECILGQGLGSAVLHFRSIWSEINGPGSWAANPFVWVVEFRRIIAP